MTAAFGTRLKRRLNRVMDTLNFEYPDYERFDKGAEGLKRKRVVSILNRQAARIVKKDENISKKTKSAPQTKAAISKKQKLDMTPSVEPKVVEAREEAPSTPSVAEVAEILKVMIDSLPIKLLSPLGPKLTNFLQKKNGGKKHELVRLPYRFKFEKEFKKPCLEWLEMIETMCNEILGNYTKKEDQLMTAAFGTRPKRRLNHMMDALN